MLTKTLRLRGCKLLLVNLLALNLICTQLNAQTSSVILSSNITQYTLSSSQLSRFQKIQNSSLSEDLHIVTVNNLQLSQVNWQCACFFTLA